MIGQFLNKTVFDSYEDFMLNFKVKVPDNFNFGYDMVDAIAAKDPDRAALLWTNDNGVELKFSMSDISRLSDNIASYFQQLGIGHGDMVMLMMKRRWQFWPTIVALHKLGAVVIPATHLLTPSDIEYRCNKADIKMIITADDPVIIDHVERAIPLCPSVRIVMTTGASPSDHWLSLETAFQDPKPFKRPARVNNNDDVMLMYFTSGTTGEPKMVAHDFTYPLGHIITAFCWQTLDKSSRHLTLADTGWGKAVWGKLYGQWICGAEVFVYDFDKFVPSELLDILARYEITSFCAPPTVFRFLIHENISSGTLPSLRYCTIAGEALNPSVFEDWKRLTGISLMEGFGQTETTLTVGTYRWMTPKPGSMGRPGPQYNVEVVDKDDKPVAAGEQGEIVIHVDGGKPLGLFKEYLHDPELTSRTIRNGLYHTGDIARIDSDGYLWYVGRIDDVIKSSGYRIGPFEVESAVMTHPAVAECAVTGVPDPIRGQLVKATVVLVPAWRDKAGDQLAKDIQKHVKNVTAPYKYPRVIEFVEELPKTISGKIRRVAIRQADNSTDNQKL